MAARQPTGPPPPPVVQRVRVRYAKRGRLRFTSHRDLARALERALRRAGVPMAYSAGFSPHPRISYVGAAPTGVASEAEYLELALAVRVDPVALRDALDAALPPGVDVVEVVESAGGPLPERMEASLWSVELPGVTPDVLRAAVAALLERDEVLVERLMKDGRRTLDARAVVVSAEVVDAGGPMGTEGVTLSDRDATLSAGDAVTPPAPAAAPAAPAQAPVAAVPPPGPGPGESVADAPGPGESVADAPGPGESVPDATSRPGADVACAILRLVVRHATPAVRPDDVLSGLRLVADLVPPVPPRATRLAQGPLTADGVVGDPLAPDRDAANASQSATGDPGSLAGAAGPGAGAAAADVVGATARPA